MTMPVSADGFLDGVSYDRAPAKDEEAGRIASQDRLAATLVRRRAMRHDQECRRLCPHRNHRRDQQHLELLLDALGLADEAAKPGDYESKLAWPTVSRTELIAMSGR
jgi:hypothetical protein